MTTTSKSREQVIRLQDSEQRAPRQEFEALKPKDAAPSVELETFALLKGRDPLNRVKFTSHELTSLCPVTSQPDISSVEIEYWPHKLLIESKSLKLFLWSFRDRGIFCEDLAVEIANAIWDACDPFQISVHITQHVRGGITTEAWAEIGVDKDAE